MEKTIASITKPKDEELKERLSAAREKLATLQIKVKEAKLPVLVLFEGFGVAGKGSVLSKIIKNMDPRFSMLRQWISRSRPSFGNHFYTDISSGFRRMDSSRSWMAAGWKKS